MECLICAPGQGLRRGVMGYLSVSLHDGLRVVRTEERL
jgi:hypothetical protein